VERGMDGCGWTVVCGVVGKVDVYMGGYMVWR
jgi:hypothetical protein